MKYAKNEIKKLYTNYCNLYHFIFCTIFRYDKALEYYINTTNYLQPKMKILDAGCSTGIATKALYAFSIKKKLPNIIFHGFDITPAMLNNFQNWIDNRNITNIKIYEADVLFLSNIKMRYDLIISSGMLEYLSNDQLKKALANLLNCLNNNGLLLLFITKKMS